jgi:hypothetical protein
VDTTTKTALSQDKTDKSLGLSVTAMADNSKPPFDVPPGAVAKVSVIRLNNALVQLTRELANEAAS